MNENKFEFEPKIVAFVCNWCTYAGADLTGTSRLKYATNVEIVRFPCKIGRASCRERVSSPV